MIKSVLFVEPSDVSRTPRVAAVSRGSVRVNWPTTRGFPEGRTQGS